MTEHRGHPYRNLGYVLMTLGSLKYILIPILFPGAMSEQEVVTMVSAIPTDFVAYVAIVAAIVAVVVCIATFLWRYVEHNDAEGLNRKTNKMKFKFIGGTVLAIVVTALLAYIASGTLVGYFGVIEPKAEDYCIFAALAALVFGITFTIIFSEGITAFGKFLEQKVKEAKEVAEQISAEDLADFKEFLAAKKAAEQPEDTPKE